MPESIGPECVILPDRGLIRISGPERRAFLQGLITNDINLLDMQPCVYACLLTPQGKFQHDFFITESNESILLDCEGGARTVNLAQRLSAYRLRARVDIEAEVDAQIYACANEGNPANSCINSSEYPDPRHPSLGSRAMIKPDLPEKPFGAWDRRRILLAVPDGSRDMIPEKSTMLESNIDKLNGISWEKGCYVGQELTARMHYRGLAKRHLYPVHLTSLRRKPEPSSANSGEAGFPHDDKPVEYKGEIRLNGELIGEMRSSCGDVGLALLKDEFAALFQPPNVGA